MADFQPTNVVSIFDRPSRPRSTRESILHAREAFRKDLLKLCDELVKETTPGWEMLSEGQRYVLACGYANAHLIALAQKINFPVRHATES